MRGFAKSAVKKFGVATAVAFAASVGGCALPPAVTVASLAADGVAYAFSGRAVADHALSFAVQEDCTLHRVILGESICHPEAPEGGAAYAGGLAEPGEQLAMANPGPIPSKGFGGGTLAAPPEAAPPSARDGKPEAKTSWVYPGDLGTGATFLAIGSHRFRTNAVAAAKRYAAYSPYIVSALINGERYYRVVIGPLRPAEFEATRAALLEAGVPEPWRVRLCGVEGVGAACEKPAAEVALNG